MNTTMTQVADLLQDPMLSVPAQPKNVTVAVSGSRFCIVPSLWSKVEKLEWNHHQEVPQLSANPDVFEMLLQYLLFGILPDVANLIENQVSELQALASPLNDVKTLIDHVEAGLASLSNSKKIKSSSLFRRKLAGFANPRKKQRVDEFNSIPIQETVYPFAVSKANATIDVDYLPNLEASDSVDSEESSSRMSSSATVDSTLTGDSLSTFKLSHHEDINSSNNNNNNTIKKASSKRFLRGVLLGSNKSPTRKLTHAEWCASDYVL
jgi:hypothetical protein